MSSEPRHRWGRGRRRQRRPGQRRNTELSLKGAKLRQVNRSDDVDDGELLGLGDEDGEAVGGAAFAPAVDFDELALALLLRRYQPRPPRCGQLLPNRIHIVRRVRVRAAELEAADVDAAEPGDHFL